MNGKRFYLLALAAESASQLEITTRDLAQVFRLHPEERLGSVATRLMLNHHDLPYRRYVVTCDASDAVARLESFEHTSTTSPARQYPQRPVAFMFPGSGAQYVNMARDLCNSNVAFRSAIESCSRLLGPEFGDHFRKCLFANADGAESATQSLTRASIGLPALFVVEYALAELLVSWGIKPFAMIGNSLGEYVAACLAGVFSLKDALWLVACRGRLLETLPKGSMLSVFLPESELQPLLGHELSLAAINGPSNCVVAGSDIAVADMKRRMMRIEVDCVDIPIEVAGHSTLVDSILPEFRDFLQTLDLHRPTTPFVSTVTGGWIDHEAADPLYWVDQLRQPVRFSDGLSTIFEVDDIVLLDVGPGRTLTSLARTHPKRREGQVVLPCIRHARDKHSDTEFLLDSLGQMWLHGCAVNWVTLALEDCR